MPVPNWIRAATSLLLLVLVSACATLPRLPAVPEAEAQDVTVLGLKDIRYWGDESSPILINDGIAAYHRELAAYRASGHTGPLPPATYLAISGGGENGAFGAGLLVGWSARGTRPQFKVVTGISTGALIAPFAFLGPRYDAELKAVYTTISGKDVFESRDYLSAFFLDALASTERLRRTIARYLTPKMLSDMAAAYRNGRLLFIGTTDLDQGRPVIWDIGKIAASGRPGALALIRSILVASAAVPGAFPPVMIDVEADGHHYQEMHVDGGASAQVFVYPPSLELGSVVKKAGIVRQRQLFVVRNARLDPQWDQVNRRTFSIIGRAITSLIQTQGIGDLYRIYVAAERDHIAFNLASIPSSFKMELKQPFDPKYMNALFDVGYRLGKDGYHWAHMPPGYTELGASPALASSAAGE